MKKQIRIKPNGNANGEPQPTGCCCSNLKRRWLGRHRYETNSKAEDIEQRLVLRLLRNRDISEKSTRNEPHTVKQKGLTRVDNLRCYGGVLPHFGILLLPHSMKLFVILKASWWGFLCYRLCRHYYRGQWQLIRSRTNNKMLIELERFYKVQHLKRLYYISHSCFYK